MFIFLSKYVNGCPIREVKKTEILMENCRRAIGLRIKETKEVYEGEATPFSKNEQGTVGLGSILFSLHFARIRICTVTQRRAKKKLSRSITQRRLGSSAPSS